MPKMPSTPFPTRERITTRNIAAPLCWRVLIVRLIVAGDDVAQNAAGDSGDALRFVFAAADGCSDPVRQPAEGEALQNDVPRSGQRRVEQSLAAEKSVSKTADELDVVRDRVGKRDDAA